MASNNDCDDYDPYVERKDKLEPSLGIGIKTIIKTCLNAKIKVNPSNKDAQERAADL